LDKISIGQLGKKSNLETPSPPENKNEDPEEGREDKPSLSH
jgi:hypothetical protein